MCSLPMVSSKPVMAETTTTTTSRTWSTLPPDLLLLISHRLPLTSYLRFRCVCKAWRAITRSSPSAPQLPWLLLPYPSDTSATRRFYSPSDATIHVLPLPLSLRRRCCGSSLGWLLLLSKTPEVLLLNPLTNRSIPLPPLTQFPGVVGFHDDGYVVWAADRSGLGAVSAADMRKLFVRKMVLSCDPGGAGGGDAVVMVLMFDMTKLAFCRVGGDPWMEIDVPLTFGVVLDVAYYNGRFYASCGSGKVVVVSLGGGRGGSPPSIRMVSSEVIVLSNTNYLLKSPSNELLLIARYVHGIYGEDPDGISETKNFRVFKIDVDRGLGGLEMNDLGGNVVFLGTNHTICASASEFPGLRSDLIYYVDTNWYRGCYNPHGTESFGRYNVCVFDTRDASVELLLCDIGTLMKDWTLTTWVTPNLH